MQDVLSASSPVYSVRGNTLITKAISILDTRPSCTDRRPGRLAPHQPLTPHLRRLLTVPPPENPKATRLLWTPVHVVRFSAQAFQSFWPLSFFLASFLLNTPGVPGQTSQQLKAAKPSL